MNLRHRRTDTRGAVRGAATVGVVAEALIGISRRALRIVVMFWPALLAWYMFGVLGRYLVIQAAGWVGASFFAGGIALMPVAILCRLIAFVAMLLTVRSALPTLASSAAELDEPIQRRRQFVEALLAGILPFFAFYLAWGYMRDDMGAFYARALAVQKFRPLDVNTDGDVVTGTLELTLTWLTGTAIVATFVLRRLVDRYRSRSARVAPVIAVYLKALWVMLAALVLNDLTTSIASWFNERQALVWLGQMRASITVHVAPLDWLLTVGGWLIGEVGGIVLFPLAWLTIAGVIYGETLDPSSPTARFLAGGRLAQVQERAAEIPSWLRRRLNDLWDTIVDGVRPVGDAFKLMWHAGPLLVSMYVLAFRGVEWLSGEIDVVIARGIGPQLTDFWSTYMPALSVIAPTLTAPLLIGVIAAAFEMVLARLRPVAGPGADRVGAEGVAVLSSGPFPPPRVAP